MKTAALITGASGGLGSALVKQAQQLDVDVVIATDLKQQEYDEPNVIGLAMNVASEESIIAAKQTLKEKGFTVKYLVNNAGIMEYYPISETTSAQLERTFRINAFGPVLTVSHFLDDLIASKGRVVQMSSISAKLSFMFMPYPNSKITLEALSVSMRQELAIYGIDLVIIRPGAIDTPLVHKLNDTFEATEHSKYVAQLTKFVDTAKNDIGKTVAPEDVSKLVMKALQAKKPKFIYTINSNFKVALLKLFPTRLREKLIALGVKQKS